MWPGNSRAVLLSARSDRWTDHWSCHVTCECRRPRQQPSTAWRKTHTCLWRSGSRSECPSSVRKNIEFQTLKQAILCTTMPVDTYRSCYRVVFQLMVLFGGCDVTWHSNQLELRPVGVDCVVASMLDHPWGKLHSIRCKCSRSKVKGAVGAHAPLQDGEKNFSGVIYRKNV